LQGRAFVFASQFASLFPVELGAQYLDAACQVVEAQDAGVPVKISAIKAIQKYTPFLILTSSVLMKFSSFAQALDNKVLCQFAPRIIQDLGPFMLNASEDTLLLVLETVSVCIEIDGGSWLTPDLANAVTSAALQVWTKTNKGNPTHPFFKPFLMYFCDRSNVHLRPF
jgi:importin-9